MMIGAYNAMRSKPAAPKRHPSVTQADLFGNAQQNRYHISSSLSGDIWLLRGSATPILARFAVPGNRDLR